MLKGAHWFDRRDGISERIFTLVINISTMLLICFLVIGISTRSHTWYRTNCNSILASRIG